MKNNSLNSIRKILVTVLLVFLNVYFLGGCRISANAPNYGKPTTTNDLLQNPEQTEESLQTLEDEFLGIVGTNVTMNEKVRISTTSSSIKVSKDFDDLFILDIMNEGDENLVFTDMEFNLRAFKKVSSDENILEWEEVILPIISPTTKVILYPDSSSNIGLNSIAIPVRMICDLDFEDHIRFYVSGVGEKTQFEYGTFLDVTINRDD